MHCFKLYFLGGSLGGEFSCQAVFDHRHRLWCLLPAANQWRQRRVRGTAGHQEVFGRPGARRHVTSWQVSNETWLVYVGLFCTRKGVNPIVTNHPQRLVYYWVCHISCSQVKPSSKICCPNTIKCITLNSMFVLQNHPCGYRHCIKVIATSLEMMVSTVG